MHCLLTEDTTKKTCLGGDVEGTETPYRGYVTMIRSALSYG